jgi:hypothetical protein
MDYCCLKVKTQVILLIIVNPPHRKFVTRAFPHPYMTEKNFSAPHKTNPQTSACLIGAKWHIRVNIHLHISSYGQGLHFFVQLGPMLGFFFAYTVSFYFWLRA